MWHDYLGPLIKRETERERAREGGRDRDKERERERIVFHKNIL